MEITRAEKPANLKGKEQNPMGIYEETLAHIYRTVKIYLEYTALTKCHVSIGLKVFEEKELVQFPRN